MKECIEPTCQDCIHCEVCDYWEKIAYPNDKDFGGGICIYFNREADVAPVIHAYWEWREFYGEPGLMLCCSNCRETEGANKRFEYCPHCGAIMDGGNK